MNQLKVVKLDHVRHVREMQYSKTFEIIVGENTLFHPTLMSGVTLWVRSNLPIEREIHRLLPVLKREYSHVAEGYRQYDFKGANTFDETVEKLKEVLTEFEIVQDGTSTQHVKEK